MSSKPCGSGHLHSCIPDLDYFAGFLSWFRNGLLATGIGVIAFVQSEVGREAGYGTGSKTHFNPF